jgi:hypothetical protein
MAEEYSMKCLTQQELLAIRDQHESWLRAQPGVVGTGVGLGKSGDTCLKIFTNHASPTTMNAIHERLSGIPLALEEIGEVRKQRKDCDATS